MEGPGRVFRRCVRAGVVHAMREIAECACWLQGGREEACCDHGKDRQCNSRLCSRHDTTLPCCSALKMVGQHYSVVAGRVTAAMARPGWQAGRLATARRRRSGYLAGQAVSTAATHENVGMDLHLHHSKSESLP
jgi:hypothetical protein